MKDHLLKVKRTFAHVVDLLKKPPPRDKIEPLSFQKVGPKNEQLGVTWLRYLVVPFGTGKC
jgi:hypothetical protein